jgi:hypothetical protein
MTQRSIYNTIGYDVNHMKYTWLINELDFLGHDRLTIEEMSEGLQQKKSLKH